MRFAPVSYRPLFGRILSLVVSAIAAAAIAGFAVAGDYAGLVRYSWALLLLAATAFSLFWMPRLDIDAHEVTVRNVFSTVHVPWPAIQNIDTKYALTLTTPLGAVASWASPAPSRYRAQLSTRADARLAASASGSHPRPGDLVDTTSGAAAFVIRSHWEDLRAGGHLDGAVVEPGTLRRDIHWATIAVLAALAAATVLGFVL